MSTQFFVLTTGRDYFTAPSGHDPNVAYDSVVYGSGGGDVLHGGTGNDWFWGAQNDMSLPVADFFAGGEGDDVMVSWAQNSFFQGDGGNDLIIFAGNPSSINSFITAYGGEGNDQIWALGGGKLYGGAGDDVIVGSMTLDGGEGNDLLIATGHNTIAYGYSGNDSLWAGTSSNVTLNGATGADVLVGNGRDTRLIAGYDTVKDTMIGANGVDHFVLNGTSAFSAGNRNSGPETYPSAAAVDVIWNFEKTQDNLILHSAGWLAPGASGVGSFSAHDGFNAEAGLAGTLIRYDYAAADGTYFHSNVVFLAGVSTTMTELSTRIVFDDTLFL